MSGYRCFKCIKSFTVEAVDDGGFFLDSRPPVFILQGKDYDPRYWTFRKPVEEIEK